MNDLKSDANVITPTFAKFHRKKFYLEKILFAPTALTSYLFWRKFNLKCILSKLIQYVVGIVKFHINQFIRFYLCPTFFVGNTHTHTQN